MGWPRRWVAEEEALRRVAGAAGSAWVAAAPAWRAGEPWRHLALAAAAVAWGSAEEAVWTGAAPPGTTTANSPVAAGRRRRVPASCRIPGTSPPSSHGFEPGSPDLPNHRDPHSVTVAIGQRIGRATA